MTKQKRGRARVNPCLYYAESDRKHKGIIRFHGKNIWQSGVLYMEHSGHRFDTFLSLFQFLATSFASDFFVTIGISCHMFSVWNLWRPVATWDKVWLLASMCKCLPKATLLSKIQYLWLTEAEHTDFWKGDSKFRFSYCAACTISIPCNANPILPTNFWLYKLKY